MASAGVAPGVDDYIHLLMSSRNSKKGKIVAVPFHQIAVYTLSSGVFLPTIRPDSFGTGLLSVSDAYELFRVKRFKFRILAFTTPCAAGVITSTPNTLPGTIAQVGELMESVLHAGPQESVWSRWVTVSKQTLAGPYAWYHTRAGTFDATESAPATFCLAGTGSNQALVDVIGEMEFKDIAATANTPEQLALLNQVRKASAETRAAEERKRLLAVLAYSGVSPSAKAPA